jgi:hypothetical protein
VAKKDLKDALLVVHELLDVKLAEELKQVRLVKAEMTTLCRVMLDAMVQFDVTEFIEPAM